MQKWALPAAVLVACLASASLAAFTEQPARHVTVDEGGNITVTCHHSQADAIRWLRDDGADLASDSAFLVSGSSGNSSLSIVQASLERHNGSYECLAQLTGGGTESSSFSVAVRFIGDGLEVQLERDMCDGTSESEGVLIDTTVSLRCLLPPSFPALTAQWLLNDLPVNMTTHYSFEEGGATLVITGVTTNDNRKFTCCVSNGVQSRSAHLMLLVAVIYPATTVTIEDHTSILHVREGSSPRLVCTVRPTPQPEDVKWSIRGVEIASGQNSYSLFHDRCEFTLAITVVSAAHEGTYTCQVAGAADSLKESTTLQIARLSSAYEVQLNPGTLVGVGREVVIKCVAVGTPGSVDAEVDIEWAKRGVADGDLVLVTSDAVRGVSVEADTVTIASAQTSDSGEFVCTARHQLVRLPVSASANLTIEEPPLFIISPDNPLIKLGSRVELVCRSDSSHSPTFSWSFGGTDLTSTADIHSAAGVSTLVLPSVEERQLGRYSCAVADAVHIPVSGSTLLSETSDLYVVVGATGEVAAPIGGILMLMCPARSKSPPITISWWRGGRQLVEVEGVGQVGVANNTLVVSAVGAEVEGDYQCRAEDATGAQVEASFVLVVTIPGDIISSPPGIVTVQEGHRLQLDCRAVGKPLPVVQWLFRRSTLVKSLNDSRVKDLMNGSMRINPIRPEHAGTYSCVLVESVVHRDVELRVSRQTGGGEGGTEFHLGRLNQNESILVLVVCGTVFLLLLASVFLLVCACLCHSARKRHTVATIEGEMGEFKRQSSIRRDNSGVLNQNVSLNPFGMSFDPNPSPSPPSTLHQRQKQSEEEHATPYSLPVTRFGQESVVSESLARTPSPTPPSTAVATTRFSSEEPPSIAAHSAAGLPNFPRANLTLGEVMGEGEFGPVLLGSARGLVLGEEDSLVAVKVLMARGAEGEEPLRPEHTLPGFAEQMKLEFTNIASILGMCTDMEPYYIIYEYLDQGDLKQFLINAHPQSGHASLLNQRDLWRIILQVADGMAYLFSQRIIHGDVAARNCLVSSDLRVKIADLGIGHDLYSGDYHDNGAQLLPVRWMPPELMGESEEGPLFSLHSDVWSFGVFCWEVISFARLPYRSWSDEEVVQRVPMGARLPEPERCPPGLYSLMEECWREAPDKRPRFSRLCSVINDLQLQ